MTTYITTLVYIPDILLHYATITKLAFSIPKTWLRTPDTNPPLHDFILAITYEKLEPRPCPLQANYPDHNYKNCIITQAYAKFIGSI